MKIQVLSAAVLVAFQNTCTNAWAPAITSLVTRKVSPRYPTSHYVASDIEKGAEEKTSAAFEDSSTKILGEPIPYEQLTIGVLKETFKGENRVSQTPDSVRSLVKAGFTVVVQSEGT